MKRLLFFVHGMGVHPAGWHAEPLGVLRDAAARYGVRDRFDEWVEPREILYDDVLRGISDRWTRSVEGVRAAMDENGVGSPELLRWLDEVTPTEKAFFWSHVVDVLLYRFFPQVATEVRTRVMKQFVEAINTATADGQAPRVAVIAHSLGTSVTHDALAYLSSYEIDGSSAYLSSHGWRLNHLFMIANVSRILCRINVPFYQSTVRPEGTEGHQGNAPCLEEYLNFRHRLDPVPAVLPFHPAGWGDRYVAAEDLDHVLDWNIHGYTHYLRHPDVHVPILNRLLDFPIGDDARAAAVAELASAPRPECLDVVEKLRVNLRQARDLVRSADQPEALIKVAAQLYALVEDARTECGALLGQGGDA